MKIHPETIRILRKLCWVAMPIVASLLSPFLGVAVIILWVLIGCFQENRG